MKMRTNKIVERAGVNAAQGFFEANGFVFQPVDLGNDYGKDAYIDTTQGVDITGFCIALQIKSGASFRRVDGYVVPCDASHEDVWRKSTVPIAGIVYDPDDQQLRWCNISQYLLDHSQTVTSIPVPRNQILTTGSLHTEFVKSFQAWVISNSGGRVVLALCSDGTTDQNVSKLLDCFAYGRGDARIFIALRYLLQMLDVQLLGTAIHILSHVTPHPDILWGKHNWVPETVCQAVVPHFRWLIDEICMLLKSVDWDEWCRGGLGESLYMILKEDPDIQAKLAESAIRLARDGSKEAAFSALYVATYLERGDTKKCFDDLLQKEPLLKKLDMVLEIGKLLDEHGGLCLFE